MVSTTELLAAYDAQMRMPTTAMLPAGVWVERDGPVTRTVGQHRGFVSAPRDLGAHAGELDDVIARQRDFFAARGEAVEWKTRGHDLPFDIGHRLTSAGFVAEEQETVLVAAARDVADISADLPDDVVVRCVSASADLRRIGELLSEVWGENWSWVAGDLAARLHASPQDVSVLLAEEGEHAVCAAWLVHKVDTEFAGLWGGSTRAAWRGRGIYRTLVRQRARLAVGMGVTYLQVDASEESRPILQRLGFRQITTATAYVWTPARRPEMSRTRPRDLRATPV